MFLGGKNRRIPCDLVTKGSPAIEETTSGTMAALRCVHMRRLLKNNVHSNCCTQFNLQKAQSCSDWLVDRGNIGKIVPSKFHITTPTTLAEYKSEEAGEVLRSLNHSDRTYKYETCIMRHT